jgi:hypothetical protein
MMPAMRGLARYLFAICSAISLLLFVAVCLLWVRSHWVAEKIEFHNPDVRGPYVERTTSLCSAKGSLRLQHWVEEYDHVRPDFVERVRGWISVPHRLEYRKLDEAHMAPDKAQSIWNTLGFYNFFERQDLSRPAFSDIRTNRIIVIPLWSLVLLSGVLPMRPVVKAMVNRSRRRFRKGAGLCPSCGYDLRASPEQCPECGAEKSVTI